MLLGMSSEAKTSRLAASLDTVSSEERRVVKLSVKRIKEMGAQSRKVHVYCRSEETNRLGPGVFLRSIKLSLLQLREKNDLIGALQWQARGQGDF